MKPPIVLGSLVLLGSLLLLVTAQTVPKPLAEKSPTATTKPFGTGGKAFFKPLIDPGDTTGAGTVSYYNDVGRKLGLELTKTLGPNDPPQLNKQFTMDNLIAFCGYGDGNGQGLLGIDLDRLSGTILNDPAALAQKVGDPAAFDAFFRNHPSLQEKEILAGTFFAPKICNVGPITGAPGAPVEPVKYGWRKVVRLKPRTDSPAAKDHQVVGVWLLFNYFVEAAAVDQPDLSLKDSGNTQVMITFATIQETPQANPQDPLLKDAAYWLDFDAKRELTDALNASFDSGQGDLASEQGNRDYFVPDACWVCHGASRQRAALNLLDTDHWFERVRKDAPAGTDFPRMAASPNGVLLEGGVPLPVPGKFEEAFEVFRILNQEILDQDKIAKAPRQLASADHWTGAHAASDKPLSLAERAIGNSGAKWTDQDEELLSHLDRYCYRCHNSVKYNAFNKAEFFDDFWKTDATDRLQMPWIKDNFQEVMPQDRHLDASVINKLVKLITDTQ